MDKLIYIVEDDKNIREIVIYALKTAGFCGEGFENATEFYEGMSRDVPSLILMDIMLPDEDGITILKKLKNSQKWSQVPVIMLTAKTTEYDKVIGLDTGADDYITKPFGVLELISRVKAVMRRSQKASPSDEALSMGELSVDEQKHRVSAAGEEIILTHKEFELLVYLMKNRGIVLSRDRILEVIWDYNYEGESRTVDVHIGSLRQKLGSCGDMIRTIRGVGYKIEE